MHSSGSKQLQWILKPDSESPPSLDEEMGEKLSLYDELLSHGFELASEGELTTGVHTTHADSKKRKNSSLSDFPSSPPQLEDGALGKKRKIIDVPESTRTKRPRTTKQAEDRSDEMVRSMAKMGIKMVD